MQARALWGAVNQRSILLPALFVFSWQARTLIHCVTSGHHHAFEGPVLHLLNTGDHGLVESVILLSAVIKFSMGSTFVKDAWNLTNKGCSTGDANGGDSNVLLPDQHTGLHARVSGQGVCRGSTTLSTCLTAAHPGQ